MKPFFVILLVIILGCSPEPTTPAIDAPVIGRLIYSRHEEGTWHIYLEKNATTPIRIGQGRFPRWSSDGTQLAFFRAEPGITTSRRPGSLWVAQADGSAPRLVTKNATVADNGLTSPYDWHPDGLRLIHLPRENNTNGLALTTIATGQSQLIGRTDLPYSGEPQFDSTGTRLVVRGTGGFVDNVSYRPVMSIDMTTGEHTIFAFGCSSSISPDGKWIANNTPLHRYMDLWTPDFKTAASLEAKKTLKPHALWDDWHWTNHNRYIVTRSDHFNLKNIPDDAYLIDLHTRTATPLTTGARGPDWPDYFIDSGPPDQSPTEKQLKAKRRDAIAEVAAYAEAKKKSTEGIPTQLVRARLRAITPIPPIQTRAYPNYLIDAEWQLLEVISGEWIAPRFIGIHFAIKENHEDPATAALKIGEAYTLTVQSWSDRPDLHTLGRLGPEEIDYSKKEIFVLKID